MTAKWVPENPDDLARRYLAGESEKALAESLGVSRRTIGVNLAALGVKRRTLSQALLIAQSETAPEERRRRAAAANEASRGRVHSFEERCKMAATRERNLADWHVSPAEIDLRRLLAERGIETIPQKAIGPYNVDLAAGSVAVEVLGGSWHRSKKHGQRLRYLLEAGWDVAYVWVIKDLCPLTPEAADDLVAYVKFREGNPAAARRYRVIRGTGELLAAAEFDLDHVPDVLPMSYRVHVRGKTDLR